ncbi:MAG: ABC transporter permease [Chitinophagaceae bacterium]
MYSKYFKIAWRSLKKNKAFAAINIIGLSLGIACGIIIFTIIGFHTSFDNFHQEPSRIYRAITEFHDDEGVNATGAVPQPLGKALRNEYTFSEKIGRLVYYNSMLVSIPGEGQIKKFQEDDGVAYAEPEYFDIFNFPLVKGDKRTALKDPNSAILTEKAAMKYFGTADAMGKTIRVNNNSDYTVTGILKNLPANTTRRQQVYLSYYNLKDQSGFLASDSSWGGVYSGSQCYMILKPGISQTAVEKQLKGISTKYYTGQDAQVFQFKLQPLTDIHFNTRLTGSAVNKSYLWALGFIGLFLIITACVNFINLATAQALNRSKEVGVRKVMGSRRSQLFWQFIAETTLITLLAVLLAYGWALLALPYLGGLFNTTLSIHFFDSWQLPVFTVLLAVIVVFLAGSYPGLVLAKFQPIMALKGKLSQRTVGGFSLRRVLVITQFAISQALIIGTIVIASQMKFSQNAELGFDKEAIVMLPLPVSDKAKMTTLKSRLSEVPGIEKISLCYQSPAARMNNNTGPTYDNREKEELWSINTKYADDQYLSVFNIPLVAGRNLFPADTAREILVNETFVKKLNLASPQDVIGKVLEINRGEAKAPIVGVIKDFKNGTSRDDVDAVCLLSSPGSYRSCALKINMQQAKSVLASCEKIWNETYSEYLYSYQFMDERVAEFYRMDNILLKMIEIFCAIAVLIGCLGLYGLVSFMAVRKTKEISIRKVLGAGMHQIVWIFGKEFSRLLLVAFVVAAPIAWYVMRQYLQDYKVRISIGVEIFGLALGVTFLVAAVTVALRTVRSALANPVKSLKSE